jgi:Cysteine-rich domain.
MEHNKEESICCGTSAWTNCNSYSKEIRVDRLREAKATGAETLITCCPKCQIHFKCAMTSRTEERSPEVEMELMDLVNLAAATLE